MQTHGNPSTKEAALQALGVTSKKQRKALASEVEFVKIRAGRQLLARGNRAPTVVVGVAGSAFVTQPDGRVIEVEAPFVLDSWAADDRRVAEISAVNSTAASLVLIDCRQRDSVFARVPALAQLSTHTHKEIFETEAQVIDLTENSSFPEAAHLVH